MSKTRQRTGGVTAAGDRRLDRHRADGRRAWPRGWPRPAWTSPSGTAPAPRPSRSPTPAPRSPTRSPTCADRDVVFTMVSTLGRPRAGADRRRRPAGRPRPGRPRVVVDCSTVSTEASARDARGLRRARHRLPRLAGQRQRQGRGRRQAQPGQLRPEETYDAGRAAARASSARPSTYVGEGETRPAGQDLPQPHARRGHPVPGRDHRAGREGRRAAGRRSSSSSTTR